MVKKPIKVIAKKPVSKEIVWSKVKSGTWFTAIIYGTKVTGKIQKEDGDVYLCQNERDGADCDNRLGFKFSWILCKHSTLEDVQVNNFKLLTSKPKDYKYTPIKSPERLGGYLVTYHRGHIMVGCTKITNAKIKKVVAKLK